MALGAGKVKQFLPFTDFLKAEDNSFSLIVERHSPQFRAKFDRPSTTDTYMECKKYCNYSE
jgi:hypothetical protein